MASAILLVLAVLFSSICFGDLSEKLLTVKCLPAAGLVGQTVKIPCSFRAAFQNNQGIAVDKMYVIRKGQEEPLFTFHDSMKTGDTRFNLPSTNDPSLELTNSAVTDGGEYTYIIITNRGIVQDGVFWISVTAKYSHPSMNSWPEVIEDGGQADLYCNTSGGYPAGVIQWFDKMNTDWTNDATLDIKEGEDKLLKMSSKLSFFKIDSSWGPFRCVVLNSLRIKEGESEFQLTIKESSSTSDASKRDNSELSSTKIVAPVVVIGSLLVGLLLLILLRGRCRGPSEHTYTFPGEPDEEKAMNQVELNAEATIVKT